jgi:hypothetical protein
MAPDWAPHVGETTIASGDPPRRFRPDAPYGVIVRHRGVNSEDVSFAGGKDPMFVHVSQRSGTVLDVATVVIGLLVGFPYLLCTMHFYVKPSRASRANHEPSACFRKAEARAFRDRFRPNHFIYRVEAIDPDTSVTIADYGAITDAEPGPYVEMAARIATTYWQANQPRFPEALIGGSVRVTAIVR